MFFFEIVPNEMVHSILFILSGTAVNSFDVYFISFCAYVLLYGKFTMGLVVSALLSSQTAYV